MYNKDKDVWVNSPEDLTGEVLEQKGRMAAYLAIRKWELFNLSPQDREDLCQEAAYMIWDRCVVQGEPFSKAFVSTIYRLLRYYKRTMRLRHAGPYRQPLSLDANIRIKGSISNKTLYNCIPAPEPEPDPEPLTWLTDQELEQMLLDARQAAGHKPWQIDRNRHTLTLDKRIIRLSAAGHTNASIAHQLDTTEGTIRNRRVRIKQMLTTLAEERRIDAALYDYDKRGGAPGRANRIQATYPAGKRPR